MRVKMIFRRLQKLFSVDFAPLPPQPWGESISKFSYCEEFKGRSKSPTIGGFRGRSKYRHCEELRERSKSLTIGGFRGQFKNFNSVIYTLIKQCQLFLVISCSLLLVACGNTSERVVSSNNSPAVESAQRIVTLTSLSSDIIERLDKSKLVGMSGISLFRESDRFRDIPRVSEGQTLPNLEKIVALKPDLAIGAKGFSDQTLNKLKELGIKTLSTEINSWNELTETTTKIAQLIGADPNPLLERFQTFLNDIPQESLSTLVLVSRQPILSPNKNSWAGDLLTKFKTKNLAADLQGNSPVAGYVTLSAEKILQQNPETLLIVEPLGEKLLAEFKAESFWKELKATQSDRVYTFDYYGLVNPGSIDKIEEACTKLKQVLTQNKNI
jgi:iron complex transport system substrate-binding protein